MQAALAVEELCIEAVTLPVSQPPSVWVQLSGRHAALAVEELCVEAVGTYL
jgi:hypothetical protein